ncbi:MAG: hypothetical protein KF773_02450 [Deltaproteobacteria bacterium]|nr:hypothetical protein [Deltaproteobacteria bacterium]
MPGAIHGGLTRTRFFDGMFLTQADLENEQVYWRMKRRLTNRALGTGIVWGLQLGVDTTAQTVHVTPGYALDCCGNDLIVECPVKTAFKELWERADPALRARAQRGTRACIVLQYVECPEEVRPVHRDACGPIGGACEPSRFRETTRLVLVEPCTRTRPTPPRANDDTNQFCLDWQYRGPRCADEHHGVYLGCVEISPTGTVTQFTPCEPVGVDVTVGDGGVDLTIRGEGCRQYVLTGPLFDHWAGQLGFPPLSTTLPALGAAFAHLLEAGGNARMLEPTSKLGTAIGFLSAERAARFPMRRASELAEAQIAAAPGVAALSRAPLRDVVAELMARLPIAVSEQESARLGTLTVGALLDAEPETILARLGEGSANTRRVNALYASAEDIVHLATKRALDVGAELSRRGLNDPRLKEALRAVAGATPEIVDAAVVAASTR